MTHFFGTEHDSLTEIKLIKNEPFHSFSKPAKERQRVREKKKKKEEEETRGG